MSPFDGNQAFQIEEIRFRSRLGKSLFSRNLAVVVLSKTELGFSLFS